MNALVPVPMHEAVSEVAELVGQLAIKRAEYARRADPNTIRNWLVTLAIGARNAPADERQFAAQLGVIMLACEDLPALVWDRESLKAALQGMEFWPTPRVLHSHLAARAWQLHREIADLERDLAEAQRPPPRPAPVGSSAYLDGILARYAERGRAAAEAAAKAAAAEPVAEPDAAELERQAAESVQRQLAALGFAPVTVPA